MMTRSQSFLRRWRYWIIGSLTILLLLLGNGTVLAQRSGQFRVEYGPVENADYREIRQIIRDSGLYEGIAQGLNATFKLPTDVTISPATCGAANAFYRASDKRIIMCDELLLHFAQLFAGHTDSTEALGEAIVYSNLFVFFHELGHGLIDLYDLPTVGREEDAVDEFSTLLLLEAGELGTKAVLKAAHWFTLESQQQDTRELCLLGRTFPRPATLLRNHLPDVRQRPHHLRRLCNRRHLARRPCRSLPWGIPQKV
jgi:Putative metallopeptidase